MTFPRPELLVHTIIPPPLHGLAPRTIKGQAWWDRNRRAAAATNLYRCWACNVPKTRAKKHQWLEGHESYNIDWRKGTCTLVEIVSLCHYCHNYIHRGRLNVLAGIGAVSRHFVNDVVKHGDALTAGLERFVLPSPADMAPWSSWVMIIDGTPYPSRFTSVDEWSDYYNWLNSSGQQDSEELLVKFRAR